MTLYVRYVINAVPYHSRCYVVTFVKRESAIYFTTILFFENISKEF